MESKEEPVHRRRRRSKRREREEMRMRETIPTRLTRIATWAVMLVLLSVLLLGSFLLGRRMAPAPDAPERKAGSSRTVRTLVDPATLREALALADQAVEAISAGELDRALAMLNRIRDIHSDLPGLRIARARALGMLDRKTEAMIDLQKAVRDRDDAAAALMLQADWLRGAGGRESGVLRLLEDAIAAAPFTEQPFFKMGDALRAQGKPAEAVSYLRKALARARGHADEFSIRLKLALAMVEAQDPQFLESELPSALARTPVPSEALIAAAARAAIDGRIEEAGEFLTRARDQIQPEFYAWAIRDTIWNLYRDGPELRELLGTAATAPAIRRSEPADQ